MEQLFLNIYYFFEKRKAVFWSTFAALVVVMSLIGSQIRIEEDITRFFPDDERVEKLNYVINNSKLAERLIFMVSTRDTATTPQPDSLVALTEELISEIDRQFKPFISGITAQIDDAGIMTLIEQVQRNLPIFLEEKDYALIDSLTRPGQVGEAMQRNYDQLISPSGMVTKKIIINDPVGFSFLALKKLQALQYDDGVELFDNYLISKDHRHLIFFINPVYKPNETGKNTPFIEGLNKMIADFSSKHPSFTSSYFGASAVAVANARQLQRDTMITISLMLVLLAFFLVGYFKRKRVPFLILIPVVFGSIFSLCCVYLLQGSISILALAAGSIILGIAINYSLHFLSHLKHANDTPSTIKDLVKPMTLGSATTVLAFLCLQFVNAAVLRDVGIFAAFSLIGAALCTLIFLPHLVSPSIYNRASQQESWIEKLSAISFEQKKWLVWVIILMTPVFLFFAPRVSFNTDLSGLNFMTNELRVSQQRLETINRASLTTLYIVSQDTDLQGALNKNEQTLSAIDRMRNSGIVQKYSSVSTFLISDSLQAIRIGRWNNFWTKEKKEHVLKDVRFQGSALKFSQKVFGNFDSLLNRTYQPVTSDFWTAFRRSFFDDYIIEKDRLATVITLANVLPENKTRVYELLKGTPSQGFDRQMLTNIFVEYVHADFNFIVAFTAILVFVALLISYGRIELTLITFVPMLITWIWILGIMALVGIEFNIVNVMISTFIFGLGDDYSIFTMDGLQQEYIYARSNVASIRTSIFLSALTTISGLGVLIFAEHPALRSIAGISIIGIICVFVMSQTIEPFLFRWLITNRTQKGTAPMTLWGICKTIFLYSFFAFGSFFLTLVGLLFKLIPAGRKSVRLAYHSLIRTYSRTLIRLDRNIKVNIIDEKAATFSRPSVIISNHSSFLDILFTIMIHPKVILLTNKWVYNSPIFGGVVRLADYYPVMEGAEPGIEKLRARVQDGYSIVVFPEGSRSADGTIKRFHKGAFYLAETLNIPIQPLVIIGAGDSIPKGQFYINRGYITLKFLPPIETDDFSFGTTYSERAKHIGRYFREEYVKALLYQRSVDHYEYKLISNYLFKGPVLEWYLRIKLKLEKNYDVFHKLIPVEANVLDLGCGYGFLCYMLSFISPLRKVTGVDYDEEKIAVAQHCYSKSNRINFFAGDISTFEIRGFDVIVIADVLHYLTPEAQEKVLVNCFNGLNTGGKLIIRDGNADLKERHRGTRITEFFSVRLLKFNKSTHDLHFISGEHLASLAARHGLAVEMMDDTRFTSNIIFVISKNS